MKKFLALFLSAALLFLTCACGADNTENTVIPPDPTAGESAAVQPTDNTQEPSLALPSDTPSEEIPDEPSAEPTAEPSQEPSQAPATQAPATQAPASTHHPEASHHPDSTHHPEESHHPAPDPSPTLPSGGIVIPGLGGNTPEPSAEPSQSGGGHLEPTGPSASDVNLAGFCRNVLTNYAFPSMAELSTDWIADSYPGLTAIPCVQRVVHTTAIGFNTAEIALVQVANSADVSAVRSILQARVNSQVAGGAFYPAAVEAWENNYRIVSKGNYLMMVVHSSCDEIVDAFNALF